MLRVLDSRQIAEWMAYYNIEPFGEHAAYWRAGVIAATIANVNRDKRYRRLTPEDFMPKEPKLKDGTQTPEEMAAVLKQAYKRAKKRGLTKKETKKRG